MNVSITQRDELSNPHAKETGIYWGKPANFAPQIIVRISRSPHGSVPSSFKRQLDPIEACEQILAGMRNQPEIVHAGDKAFHSPISDRITMPPQGLFENAEEYWSTFWHE